MEIQKDQIKTSVMLNKFYYNTLVELAEMLCTMFPKTNQVALLNVKQVHE